MFDPSAPARGYQLLWPRRLFGSELRSILATFRGRLEPALEVLFDEALRGPDPLEDLHDPPRTRIEFDPWSGERVTATFADPVRALGMQILEHLDALPTYQRRRYYAERHGEASGEQQIGGSDRGPETIEFQRAVADQITALIDAGYLDRLAGDVCEDQKQNEQPQNINRLITEGCGLTDAWPLDLDDGPRPAEEIYTLIEVFHDLVARPRTRNWHSWDEHYWYGDFNENTGQAVYRWKINDLLQRHGIDLELAEEGDDRGQLVVRQQDPRQDLIRATPAHARVDGNQDRVQHAISLYRKRNVSTEDKIRACRELADVLESRRQTVLKPGLLRGDEPDLFQVMNKFAIRHHREDQLRNYDPLFLDWIFWWFLAAAEASSRLIARDTEGGRA